MSRYTPPAGSLTGAFSPPPPPPPGNTPGAGKRRSGIGAAALVVGLLALLLGWVPVVGLVMIVPAVLAILLGVVGFVSGAVTGRTGKVMPFLASLVGVVAFLVPPVSTALFALAITPWAYTVGMDQVQIELEHDLKRQGVEPAQAERVSSEIGDALRSFAKPSRWRDGISAGHRFALICDDYEEAMHRLDEDDIVGREKAAEKFQASLARLAERHGANLSAADLKLVVDQLEREIQLSADNWRQHQRRSQQVWNLQGMPVRTGPGACPIFGGGCPHGCEPR